MLDSFGARLRHQREAQGIALNAIAENTKIKQSLLEALERDDVSHWPTGIFRRAYIRAYAVAIGLNPDVVVREFLEVHPEPAEAFSLALESAMAADAARVNAGPPARLRSIVDSALGSLSRLRRGPAVETLLTRPEPPSELPVSDESPVFSVPVIDEPAPMAAEPVVARAEAIEPALQAPNPDLIAVADLCTEFGRVESSSDVQPLLKEAARIMDAIGLIVWAWDTSVERLRAALVHGYPERVLAQLPTLRRDADNATAAAFRSVQACSIMGTGQMSGALAVPLITPDGCAGVLAIELPHGREQLTSVRAVATIVAAQLAQLVGRGHSAEVAPETELVLADTDDGASSLRHASSSR